MRRVSVAGAAFVLLALTRATALPASDRAISLLCAALAAPATVSYTGLVESLRIGERGAQASVYRIEHRAPNFTRRTYSAPPVLSGDAIVTRGDVDYAIDVKARKIEQSLDVTPTSTADFTADEALIRRNYRAVEENAEALDGRQTVTLTAINRYTNRTTLRVQVDRATKLVLDQREYAGDGSLRSEVRFESIRYARVPIRDFRIPSYPREQVREVEERTLDTAVLNEDAGFSAQEPHVMPEGFVALEGDLTELHGIRTVQLLYSDGIRTFSLFTSGQAVRPEMGPLHPAAVTVGGRGGAEYAKDGALDILTWNDGRLYYTLVGELELAELQRMAGSVRKP